MKYKIVQIISVIGLIISGSNGEPFRDTTKVEIEDDGYCRVLAMRGGGTKGAYEIGALKAMAHMLDPIDIAYDVVEGVSIGSINAAAFATFEKGDEKSAINFLEDLWHNLPAKDFWENWPLLGPIESLWRPSLIDNTKMRNKLHEIFDNSVIRRSLNIQAVDMDTGKMIIFDETTPVEDLAKAIIASSSIPGIFMPQKLGHYNLVDGGVYTNLKFTDAIAQCNEKGYPDEKIIVDLILCGQDYHFIESWTQTEAKYKNAYDLYKRKDYFQNFYGLFEDVTREVRGYPKVHFRHLLTPQAPLPVKGWIPLFDDVDVAIQMLEQGEEETRRNLKHYLCEVRGKCGDDVDENNNRDQQNHVEEYDKKFDDDQAMEEIFGPDL